MGVAANKAKLRDLAAVVQSIKAAPGVLLTIEILNGSAAAAFIQIFDKLSGNVVLGTDNPDKEYTLAAGASLLFEFTDVGVNFNTGISIASTTTEKGAVGSAAGVEVFVDYL